LIKNLEARRPRSPHSIVLGQQVVELEKPPSGGWQLTT
jgi:hypothetical protein